MKITNKKKVILLSIIGSLILILSISYAFFKPIIDKEKSTGVDVVAKTIDQFMFIQGDSINLELNQLNFAEGSGNITGSTTTTAKLIANNKTNQAEQTYYVYFYIGKNEFDYSTDEEKPEIILTLKDPNGNNITNLDNLTYVTESDVSGFDITNYQRLITVAEEYEIATTSSTVGTSQEWEATVTVRNLDINQIQLAGKELSAQFVLSREEKEFIEFDDLILANNYGKEFIDDRNAPNFNNIAIDNEGMFAMEDDYTSTTGNPSYYFRGAVDNNWVKFADFYWRIVRINGDGSVKLIYSGKEQPTEDEAVHILDDEDEMWDCLDYCEDVEEIESDDPEFGNCLTECHQPKTTIGYSAYNLEYRSAEYIGYKYEFDVHRGHEEDSTIKAYIDKWYEDNLIDYEDYLSDFVVCNDRSFEEAEWIPIGLPVFWSAHYSDAYYRVNNKTPKLKCTEQEDAYTVKDKINGNGQLKYPIGLLTVDEVIVAGGKLWDDNESLYLTNGNYYLLVSPSYVDSDFARVYDVSASGYVYNDIVSITSGACPIVSLLSGVSVSGTGHWNDPYVVE